MKAIKGSSIFGLRGAGMSLPLSNPSGRLRYLLNGIDKTKGMG